MKNTIVLAAVAGIASAAAAQTGYLSIVPSVATIDSSVNTTFTVSVYGGADFGTHIAGGAFSMANSGGAGIVDDMTYVSEAWALGGTTDRGHMTDGNYEGIVFGQLIIPSFGLLPNAASSLADGDVLIGVFTVTIAANSEGMIDWAGGADTIGTFGLEIYDEATQTATSLLNAGFNFGAAQVNVIVPAPSAMALLGLGGLVAGRRRR